MAAHTFKPIGWIETPFKYRFGIPRQAGLVPEAQGIIHLDKKLRPALNGLESFSHLWVIFIFHEHGAKTIRPTIRPPRLGGKEKVGVFASRSPHRPNPIGMSAFKIISVDAKRRQGPIVTVEGVDLLHATPILDIKPYLPYADQIPKATGAWAEEEIMRYKVTFTDEMKKALPEHERILIASILSLDPRPAFQKRKYPFEIAKSEGQKFGMWIGVHDVQWEIYRGGILVTDLLRPPSDKAEKTG